MDDTIANVQCEACGNSFDVLARNYEKVIQEDQPVLCNSCFDTAMEKADKVEPPKRDQFEHLIMRVYPDCNMEDESRAFAQCGKAGWELVQITNQKAYFKRLYVEGLS